MSDRTAKSAPASDAATTALQELLTVVATYEKASRTAYRCRGCDNPTNEKWEGLCPACNRPYRPIPNADLGSLKERIVKATTRYADAVKDIGGYSWKIVHNSNGVPLLPGQD